MVNALELMKVVRDTRRALIALDLSLAPMCGSATRRTSGRAGRCSAPAATTADGPRTLIDAGPFHAGVCVARRGDIRPAAELVPELSG